MGSSTDSQQHLANSSEPRAQNHETTYNFAFTDFLKKEYRFGLDARRPTCKAFMQGHCPLNENCPDRHYMQSRRIDAICKHWLRGLCKKGNACEFLHEYNLRAMPECEAYARTLTCINGSDCLYLHIDPALKRSLCPHYEQGFCPLGPYCAARHVKQKRICRYYMAGFCPNGRDCEEGAHPAWKNREDLPKPEVKIELSEEEKEAERQRLLAEVEKQREEEEQRDLERPFHQRQGNRGKGGRQRYNNRQRRDRY